MSFTIFIIKKYFYILHQYIKLDISCVGDKFMVHTRNIIYIYKIIADLID